MSAYRSPYAFQVGPPPSGRYIDTGNARPYLCNFHPSLPGLFHSGGGRRGAPQTSRFAYSHYDVFGGEFSGVGEKMKYINMYKHFFKRLIDFIIVFCVLAVIWPILLIITLWLHFANKGAGAFFFQERPGKDEKIFKVIKFKTMTDERDATGNLLPDAERLTKIGRLVRSTSIDELPQLINVLKGDMALIGPRPLLVQYLPLYSEEQARRHDVRPGITGWAQVNGRNAISWTKKFELDVWYVDHCSFLLDLKIILLTIKKVFVREGISQEGQATMEYFTGNN